MTAAHATSAIVDLGDGVARDPHRPRPAHARGRRRPDRRRTGVGGDVGARLHLPARPARGRGAARHARPRLSPLPGRVRRPGRSSGSSRRSTSSPRRRARRSTCAGRIARAQTVDGADRRGARAAPDGDRDARCARRRRPNVAAVYSIVVDALTRRLLELAVAEAAPTSASSSRGWRSAARRGERRCRAPTSTARSCGSAPTRTTRSRRGCTRSGGPWSSGLEACGLQRRRARRDRVRSRGSSARSIPGSAPSAAGSTTRPRRRRWSWSRCSSTAGRCGASTPGRRSPTASASRRATLRCSGCWPASRSRTARRPASSGDSWSSRPGEHRGRLDLKQRGVTPDRRPGALGRHRGRRDERVDDASGCARPPPPEPCPRPRRARSRTRSR